MVTFKQPETMRKNLAPGSLVHTGEQKMERPRLRVFAYNPDEIVEKEVDGIREAHSHLSGDRVTWINIDGLHDVELFREVQQLFQIHPLVLEDILNVGQRPKFESHGDYILIVVKSIGFNSTTSQLEIEQISFLLGRGYVLTFQERPGDFFESVRERLRRRSGRIRSRGADYLVYALIDAIVDTYYQIPEAVNDLFEQLEARVLASPQPQDLEEIYNLKRQIVFLEKALWPLRELVDDMIKDESGLITEEMSPFLQDLYDHSVHLIEAVQTFREMASNLQDLYLTTVSKDMNQVMKVLAIIATIFIPLTFLAGVFGMNFEFMPELKIKGAYYITLAVMILVAVLMTFYFKKKKWM